MNSKKHRFLLHSTLVALLCGYGSAAVAGTDKTGTFVVPIWPPANLVTRCLDSADEWFKVLSHLGVAKQETLFVAMMKEYEREKQLEMTKERAKRDRLEMMKKDGMPDSRGCPKVDASRWVNSNNNVRGE